MATAANVNQTKGGDGGIMPRSGNLNMPHQQQFTGEYRENEQTFIDGGSFSNNLAQSLLGGSNFHSEILPQAAGSDLVHAVR